MKKRVLSIVVSLSLIFGLVTTLRTTQNSKAEGYDISNPRIEEDGTVTWDCIYFGNYWQNDTNGDGKADQNDDKEPIKWRVLSVDGDDAFLLADKNLDGQQYNKEQIDVTWETCTLRNWLNSTFLNNAFSEEEQRAIKDTTVVNEDNEFKIPGGNDTIDKVYLLSISEVCNKEYGLCGYYNNTQTRTPTSVSKNTNYVNDMHTGILKIGNHWWLRSPGVEEDCASFIYENGSLMYYSWVYYKDVAVRPVLHLDISNKNLWKYESNENASPTPTPTRRPSTTPINTFSPTITPKPTQSITITPIPTPTIEPNAEPKIISQKNEPKIITAPSKVNCLTVKNNKKKLVTLSWKKVKNTTGYQVQYATNTAFAKKLIKNTKKNKLVIKNLKKKKTYSFRVRAYKINNGSKLYGNWCKAKKVKIKK